MTNIYQTQIDQFKQFLKITEHYSTALPDFLIQRIIREKITTFQQIHDVFKKYIDPLIQHFTENTQELALIENKNPMCLEAMRDYLFQLFRGVHSIYKSDIEKFTEGLCKALRSQKKVIGEATEKVAKYGRSYLQGQNFTRVLVYNYSKSVALALRRMGNKMGGNLEVYICHGGLLCEGVRLFNEVSLDVNRCYFIEDIEANYYMDQVDCVLTGAEVILQDGSIINRTGTYMISLCAQSKNKPFIVFAQSYKFLKKIYLLQKDIPNHKRDSEKRLPIILTDLIPAKMIKHFCTDIGCSIPETLNIKMEGIFA